MPRTTFDLRLVPLPLLALVLAACTPSGIDMNASSSESAASKAERPEYRQNPQPKQGYRITVAIDGAPGEFALIEGYMQYDVANRECLPPPKLNPGGYSSPVPYRTIPFELQRQTDGTYTGTVFTDGMIDEDYHGYGVCRWRLLNVQVLLQATGAEGETRFYADLPGDELASRKAKAIYYLKRSYPRHPETKLEQPFSAGQPDRSKMAPELTDEDLFTIVLASKEMTP